MLSGYGIQLYSVRDITGTDMPGALRGVRQAGYSFVEFAGFFGIPAEDIKSMLADNGLCVSGTHTGLPALEGEELAKTIRYHQAIGCKNIIIPGHDLSTQDKIDDFIARIAKVQPVLSAEGLTLGYHNHHFEFMTSFGGTAIYDQLLARTALNMELDTFWAYVGGCDPLALMESLGDRLHFIHIKDGLKGGEGFPLGKGEAPVKAVWEKARAMRVQMVVESETLAPDGMTEARICADYLKQLEENA